MIGQAVSEEKPFEIVDGRRRRRTTGELKRKFFENTVSNGIYDNLDFFLVKWPHASYDRIRGWR